MAVSPSAARMSAVRALAAACSALASVATAVLASVVAGGYHVVADHDGVVVTGGVEGGV